VLGSSGSGVYAILASAGTWSSPQRLAKMTTVAVASCPVDNGCTVAGGSKVISQS